KLLREYLMISETGVERTCASVTGAHEPYSARCPSWMLAKTSNGRNGGAEIVTPAATASLFSLSRCASVSAQIVCSPQNGDRPQNRPMPTATPNRAGESCSRLSCLQARFNQRNRPLRGGRT